MLCPNDTMLSMYIDGALESGAADVLAGHVATCQRCTQTMRQWATAQQVVGEVWLRRQTDSYSASTTSTCPGQPEMLNAVSGLLTPQERADLDAHLRDCDACLVQMRALRRTVRLLRQEHWLAPPEPLRRSARNAIVGSATRLGIREMARVVIEVAQRGLKVLEASWDPVTLDMQIMPLSASLAALRTQRGEEEQGVDIRHVMGDVVVHLTLIPAAHDTVQLYLRAQKQGVPLSQVRVTVRREGRTVYARKLSVAGEMQVPQLTLGEYIMSLPQEGVEMMVVLQTAPAT